MGEWDIVEQNPVNQSPAFKKSTRQQILEAMGMKGQGVMPGDWQPVEQFQPTGKESIIDYAARKKAERTLQGGPDFIGSAMEGVVIPTKREVIAEALPIAGDIALTAMAPEVKGASALAQVANYMIRAGAAGAGGFVGELGRQKVLGRRELDIAQALRQGATGAIGEAGTGLAVGALKRGAEPLINLAADFTTAAKPLSRKAFAYLSKTQAKTKNLATQRAIDFVESLAAPTAEEAGLAVGKAIAGKTDFAKIYKPWNDAIDQIAKSNRNEILLDDTTQYLQEGINKFYTGKKTEDKAIKEFTEWLGFSNDARSVATIKQMMRDGYVGPNDAKYVMANFWRKSYGSTTDAANTWKQGLKTSFLSDIERQSPGAAIAKDIGDKVYASMNQFMRESPAAKRIIQKMDFGRSDRLYFEDFPERVGDIIFKKSPDEIRQLRNAVVTEKGGDEAWKMLSLNNVRNIFESSMSRNPVTGKLSVKPAELADKILQSEEVIKASMPLGEWNRLRDEAYYFADMANKFETIPVNDGFGLLEAWSILSPKSHKFFKSAFKGILATGKQATKASLHLGASLYDNPMP